MKISFLLGWCLVRFNDSLLHEISLAAASLEPFFSRSEVEKMKFHETDLLGYNVVRGLTKELKDGPVFKEKLTFVTGSRFRGSVTQELSQWIRKSDALTRALCKAASGMHLRKVATEIPLLDDPYDSFALFDVARYLNTTLENVPEGANVASHFDPGLLAVSWFSNNSGLQVFQKSTQTFVDVPLDLGVVWAGDAGHRLLNWAHGVHRVLYSIGVPRLTFWTEACVAAQLNPSGVPALFPHLDTDVKSSSTDSSGRSAAHLERLLGVSFYVGVYLGFLICRLGSLDEEWYDSIRHLRDMLQKGAARQSSQVEVQELQFNFLQR